MIIINDRTLDIFGYFSWYSLRISMQTIESYTILTSLSYPRIVNKFSWEHHLVSKICDFIFVHGGQQIILRN